MEILNTALFIYYFNIIMISLIIVFVLGSWYKKASSVIINVGEKATPMNNTKFPPTVKYVVLFGLVFFTLREFGGDIIDWLKEMYEMIGDKIG